MDAESQVLPIAFRSTAMATLANITHIPTCALVGASPCRAARSTKAKQLGGGALRVRGHPSCKGEAESRGGRRRGLVVGSVVGSAVLVASVAAVAVAARAMATSGAGGREAAILATRRGMQLFAQVGVLLSFCCWDVIVVGFFKGVGECNLSFLANPNFELWV